VPLPNLKIDVHLVLQREGGGERRGERQCFLCWVFGVWWCFLLLLLLLLLLYQRKTMESKSSKLTRYSKTNMWLINKFKYKSTIFRTAQLVLFKMALWIQMRLLESIMWLKKPFLSFSSSLTVVPPKSLSWLSSLTYVTGFSLSY